MLRLILCFSCALAPSLLAQARPAGESVSSIESLIRSQQYDLALQAAQSTLQKVPGDFRVWALEGIIFSIKGSDHDAEAAFEKALSLSPDYPAALKGEAQLLYRTQDKLAIPLLEKILKADPNDTTAREMLAVSEAKQGKCQPAVDNFAASGDVIKTHPESLERYGYCLMSTKQPEKAIPVFQQLVSSVPNQTYPRYDLAVLLVLTKQYQAALEVLIPLVNENSSDADILSLAAEAYEGIGDTPHAVPLIRQAIVLNPTKPDYYVSFAGLCLDHDSFQTGIDMMTAGMQRIPGSSSLYISRGMLYAQLAQYDKAEDDFKKAEEFDSAQTLSSYAADLAELQRNRTDETAPTIRAQIRAHPSNPLFHYLLAKVLMDQGAAPGNEAFQEATRSALRALKLKPDLVAARDLLASIYISSGQSAAAAEQCRIALQYAPSDQSAIYHLIIALRHSGQTAEIQTLARQLSDLKEQARQKEDGLKRYRLVEQPSSPD